MTDTLARIEQALTNLRDRWQRKLANLEDMKARGDLTPDWGECSLINAKSIVSDLAALASVAPPAPAAPAPPWSDETKRAIAEIDDNRRHAHAIAGTIIAGAPPAPDRNGPSVDPSAPGERAHDFDLVGPWSDEAPA